MNIVCPCCLRTLQPQDVAFAGVLENAINLAGSQVTTLCVLIRTLQRDPKKQRELLAAQAEVKRLTELYAALKQLEERCSEQECKHT